jgi:hypothetical protein
VLLGASLFLFGCPHAVEVSGEHLHGRMVLETPPQWTVVKNRRLFGNHLVVLRSPDGCCLLQAQLIREDFKSRSLPLHIVADTLSIGGAHNRGLHSELLGGNTIDLDGREAWATVLRRHYGPHERLYTTVITRTPEHVVQLSLEAPFMAPLSVTSAWQHVIETFSLPQDPPGESPLFEPLPRELEDVGSVD